MPSLPVVLIRRRKLEMLRRRAQDAETAEAFLIARIEELERHLNLQHPQYQQPVSPVPLDC